MNTRKIVVLSGSFNPPTTAHYRILLAAVEQLGAERGIFVPTADKSLRYKMRKAGFPLDVLAAELRLSLLKEMCAGEPRLTVSDIETLHPNRWYSTETMDFFQSLYPGAELYYLIGSDNLAMFLRSHRLVEFLSRYSFGVVRRGDEDVEQILRSCPEAWARRERFRFLTAPAEMREISSTAVRRMIREREPGAKEILHPKVWEYLREADLYKDLP